jgi:hypothetical protein
MLANFRKMWIPDRVRDDNPGVLFMSSKVSLTRYLVEQQRSDGHIPGQLRLLLEVVARACKSISHAVNKGALGKSRKSWTSSPTRC